MQEYFRRTWVEVNLDALKYNYEKIKEKVSNGAQIMAVVKADAYGHGVENAVKLFTECGCNWFAVSNLEEAMQVRSVNADCSILILGYTPAKYAQTLAYNNISQSLFNEDYAKQLSEYALKEGVTVSCHIKVDTGMGRLGFVYHDNVRDVESVEKATECCRLPGIFPEGVFTHFSCADEDGIGEVFTACQYDLFRSFISSLEFNGITIPYKHCCNSAATVLHPEMHLDLVRPGVILYGLMPSDYLMGHIDLKPAMKLKTVVSMVKELEAQTPISYGRKYTTDKKERIATIPIGYADGYSRLLSGKAKVKINGEVVPVLGNICMDQCMLDVSSLNEVSEGMSVTVFDDKQDSPLSVDNLAKLLGTINYELICSISKRVPRIYYRDGELNAVTDYMK